ncbi:hypothetical protein ACSSS7_006787 [Eimeria intestinalis]
MSEGGEPPRHGGPPMGGPPQLAVPLQSLGGLPLQQQQQPFSQQQLLTQHLLPVQGKPAPPTEDTQGSLADREGPPYWRPPLMQQQLPAPFSLQARSSLHQLQLTHAQQQQQAVLPTQPEQQSLHLPLEALSTLPRKMQQQAAAADAAAAAAAVCAAAASAAPGQQAPHSHQQLDPQHRRMHQLQALHQQPLLQASQQQQQQQQQQQATAMHAVQQLLQQAEMMQQSLQHHDVGSHQLYQQLSLLQPPQQQQPLSLRPRDYIVGYPRSSSATGAFLEDRGALGSLPDPAGIQRSRGPSFSDVGAQVVRQRRASTEQAAATAVAVAAAVAASDAAGGGCCPSTERRGPPDQGGPPVSEKRDKKRRAPERPPPPRKRTARAAQQQQQQQQQQHQQLQQQTGRPLVEYLPLPGLDVSMFAPCSQQEQLLLPQHLSQHSSTPQEWGPLQQQQQLSQQQQQQQQLSRHQQQRQELMPALPYQGQQAKAGGRQQLPSQSPGPIEVATLGDSERRVQQLLQLHRAAALLQQQEVDLAVRELEVVYLPLFWECNKREAETSNSNSSSNTSSSSTGSSNSSSSNSSNSRDSVWSAPVGHFVRWKGEKARAFRAVGEGSWMLWPAERQDARCATLQQQLRLLQPCYLSEQQQMLLLEQLWCNGGDAAAAFTAAVLGPPDGRRPLTLAIMKLPPPSCFHWAAAVNTQGIPFVWKPLNEQQQQQKQQQQQQDKQRQRGGAPFRVSWRAGPSRLKSSLGLCCWCENLSRLPPRRLRVSLSKELPAMKDRGPRVGGPAQGAPPRGGLAAHRCGHSHFKAILPSQRPAAAAVTAACESSNKAFSNRPSCLDCG